MALLFEVINLLTLVLVFVLMPAVLMVSLFILSRRFRGMFDQIGFSRKEIGLLIFGSLGASLLSVNVPVVVVGSYLLAINIAGAVIPVVLSVHLLRSKRIHPASWSLGILGVSLVTFLFTRVQPSAGIVAEFPWLFFPSLSAAFLALTVYSRKSAKAPAYAYSTATLGSLIGADVYHLPELFEAPEFIGSIGGAGVYDLVYLAGLLSLAMVLVFATSTLRQLKAKLPYFEIRQGRVSSELAASTNALLEGNHKASVQRSLVAVQTRMRHLAEPLRLELEQIYPQLLKEETARRSYLLLVEFAGRDDADETVARWAMYQAQYLLGELEEAHRRRYAPVSSRAAAFAIDAVFMLAIMMVIGAVAYSRGTILAEGTVLGVAIFLLAWSIQVIYFTLFEWLMKGRTPGKRLMNLRVVDLEDRPPDFITVFTRNVVRVVDFVLFLYALSVLAMLANRRVQRFGDMVAETVVLDEMVPPPVQVPATPAPQPAPDTVPPA